MPLILLAHPLHVVVRQGHRRIGHQDDLHARALLDVEDLLALLVEEEGGDLDREPRDDAARQVLHRFFFDDPQYRQGKGLRTADVAAPVAGRARPQARFPERRTQPLARHLEEPETRDTPELDPCPILLQRFAQPVLDLALVSDRTHVDEIDDDQPPHVAQPQLAGNLVGGFEIRVERGLLDIPPLGRPRRVHVDAHQRLGMVDHDAPARGQADRVGERGLYLALDLETAEQGHAALVTTHPARALRHHLGDEVPGLPVHRFVVDQDLAHVLAEIVADRTDDDVAFLVDEERRRALVRRGLDRSPQLEQIVQVPLQPLLRPPDPGRAYDEPHARGHLEGAQRLAQRRPLFALDAARDPPRPGIVGHEDEIAAGKARERGECGALPAALLLLHLYEKLHPLRKGVLDGRGLARPGLLPGVVLARDLLERQEAVPLRAVVHERGFQAGLDPRDLRLVDARLALAARGDFDVEVVEKLAVHHRDPAFLGLGRVDQHSFHCFGPSAGGDVAAGSGAGVERGEGEEIENRCTPPARRRCCCGPVETTRIERSVKPLRLDARSARPARIGPGLPGVARDMHRRVCRDDSTIGGGIVWNAPFRSPCVRPNRSLRVEPA